MSLFNSSTQNIRNYLDFLWAMTEKELKARYKNTFFGFLWIFVNPLFQMLVIGFIFRFFVKEPIEDYFLYLLVGLLIWNFFSLSLLKTTPSIVNERSLIKKAKFPREVIPLSIIFSNFIHLILALLLLLIPTLFIRTLDLMSLPKLFLGFILLLPFTIGISLFTSALNVRFRDINFFVQAILILWFYFTPIVYSINVIPRSVIWLWRINPLTSIVQLFQSAFIAAVPGPGPAMLLSNTVLNLIMVYLGIKLFFLESKYFDDWV